MSNNEELKLALVDSIMTNKEVGFSEAVKEATRLVRLVKKEYKDEELTSVIDVLISTYTLAPDIRSSLDRFKMAQFLRYTHLYLDEHNIENMNKHEVYELIIEDCKKNKNLHTKINNEYAMRGIIYGLLNIKEEKQKTKE